MSKLKIVCIIPAFNEEDSISETVLAAGRYVDEVVVVDDGSSDKTLNTLRNIENNSRELSMAKFHILHHFINRGQGAALQTGNQFALSLGADVIVHFDGDGQFLAKEILDVVKPIIDNEADVSVGSRFLDKASKIPFLKKYIIFPLANLFLRIFLELNLTDPQNGFRALSRDAALIIDIEQSRMAHCTEILIKSKNNKLRISEVPVTVIYKRFGQNFGGGMTIIKDLFVSKFLN